MQWKSLFKPVANFAVTQARDFMGKRSVGEYQLLDVRQPKEYEQEHIPGGILIPLGELPARLEELEKDKPLIVYCAIGGRSRAAAQLLAGKGFSEVYNLTGGIKAWNGEKVAGGLEDGLEMFQSDANYDDALQLAYGMENGLQQFYLALAETAVEEEQLVLFMQLAGFEEKHKARLAALYLQAKGKDPAVDDIKQIGVMEGGRRVEEVLQRFAPQFANVANVLDFAMGLEVQAYDLYGRMAMNSTNESTRQLFIAMMDEERTHLGLLAKRRDEKAGGA